MANKKIKKIFLTLFVVFQILLLGLGNVLPASAVVWTTVRKEADLEKLPSGIKDDSEYNYSASYKKNDQVPKVSVVFSSTNPKPGEEVTAVATTTGFANDPGNLYFTWFLKRKGCDPKDFNTNSENYKHGKDYPALPTKVEDGASVSPAECDVDEDGILTVNDWKIEAARRIAQNGFKPDTGGRYSSLNEFYASETDEDGYRTWQGGADMERMPNHCYGYDATSGFMFEFLDEYLQAVPMCPNDEPAVCGKTIQYKTDAAVEDVCSCILDDSDADTKRESPCYCTDRNNSGTYEEAECEAMPNMTLHLVDGAIVPSTQASCHYDCDKITTHTACQAVATPARCSKVTKEGAPLKGKLVAMCGPDSDGDGLDDNEPPCTGGVTRCSVRTTIPTSRMTPFCPTGVDKYKIGDINGPFSLNETTFNSLVEGGLNFNSEEYYSMAGEFGAYQELPACTCDKAQRDYSTPAGADEEPYYEKSNDEPFCEDESPTIDDLLCGSLTFLSSNLDKVNINNQFHTFPVRILPGKKNYYEVVRDYYDEDDNARFRYKKEKFDGKYGTVDAGKAEFKADDERFWGTDPRNPSTAANGKSDEANVIGLGATEFTWDFKPGDEVGVAVEGTSNVGTKFPDSSRMIMWAFSKSEVKTTNSSDATDAACQPKYAGSYPFFDFENGQRMPMSPFPIPIPMPTGFMDFDRCIEKSTLPLVVSAGSGGAQPKMMEVDLSATPKNPMNDENGEGQGDVVELLAVVSGADNPENDLNFSWTIQRYKPIIKDDLSVAPTDSDWEKAEGSVAGSPKTICGGSATGVCPLQEDSGGKVKTKGIGLSDINFALNLAPVEAGEDPTPANILYQELFNANGEGYLRIKVEVREADDMSNLPNSRVGYGTVVLKVSSNQNRLKVFRPKITADGKLSFSGSEPICVLGAERAVCPVTKNEIVGLTINQDTTRGAGGEEALTDFDWFASGRSLRECNAEMSSDCVNNAGTKFIYLPITGNSGDSFSVGLRANNIAGKDDQSGKKIELLQQFEVVDPSVKIVPAGDPTPGNGAWKKKIGSFVDPTLENDAVGKYTEDFSESILETAEGNEVTLALDYNPDYIGDGVSAENWVLDGAPASSGQFKAGSIGTVHNVSAGASYAQSTDTYKILKSIFGISPAEMTAKNIGHSVQVEVNKEAGAVAFKNPTRFMANLLSKVPAQVLFFIRLVLSMGVVLLLTGLIFSIFPATTFEERRRV